MAKDETPENLDKQARPSPRPGDKPDSVEKRGGQTTPAHAPLPAKGTQLPVPPPPPKPEPSKDAD
jgi:hypothetical protein